MQYPLTNIRAYRCYKKQMINIWDFLSGLILMKQTDISLISNNVLAEFYETCTDNIYNLIKNLSLIIILTNYYKCLVLQELAMVSVFVKET